MLPLSGVRVLAVEQAVSGPFATRQLADWGARVIKVERPPQGDFARYYDRAVDGLSSYFVWLNRSKESVSLSFKTESGLRILEQLLAAADVLVENLAPGSFDHLGLTDSVLRSRYPRLIVCHVSGYGPSGPYRDRKAYDLLIQSEAGFLSVTGTPESPAKAGISIADIAAGQYACMGVLLALRQRDQTGSGTIVDIAMLEALGEWMSHAAYLAAYGGSPPARTGAHHATIVPYGVYGVGDGGSIFLAVQNDAEWQRFCADVLARPEFVDMPELDSHANRARHRDVVDAAISEAFSRLTVDRVRERLDRAKIAHAGYNTMQQFWDHPQLEARQRWQTVEAPGGPVRALLPPVNIAGQRPRMDRIPATGADTRAVLGELGYTADDIRHLAEEGAV